MIAALTANRRLATALGWSNIIHSGGALLGTPPPGAPECRGQALIPNWSGDWRECGPLIGEYHIHLDCSTYYMEAKSCSGPWISSSLQSRNHDEAARDAIVQAVCAWLERGQ